MTEVAKITAVVLSGICLAAAAAATIVVARDIILLIFLGVLFGVFLTHCSGLIADRSPLNYGWSLAIVTILICVMLVGGPSILGASLENRMDGMSSRLDDASEKLESWLDEHPVAMQLFSKIPYAEQILTNEQLPFESNTENRPQSEQAPCRH